MEQLTDVVQASWRLIELLERESIEISNALQADLLDAYRKLLNKEALLIKQYIRRLQNF